MAYLPQGILPALPCALPKADLSSGTDAVGIAKGLNIPLSSLSLEHFTPDALWRDTFALTGTLRTLYSAATVAKAWNQRCLSRQAGGFQLNPDAARAVCPAPGIGWLEVPFTFETAVAPASICSGFVSVVPDEHGTWKIWLLRTILDQFQDLPNVDALEPGPAPTRQPLHEGAVYECVVVGCGQSGLSVAGRLQALGVSYLVVEKAPRVGDSWLQRYESMKLHSVRDAAQLPFDRTFTEEEYPEFMGREDLARGYQAWAERYCINISFSTELTSGTWDDSQRKWTLHLRLIQGEQVTTRTVTCSHVVMAIGAGGQEPVRPTYPGEDTFQGDILHTAEYKSPRPWRGKHGVIIGSANSAHDTAADMVGTGMASITMVQRSQTCIIPKEFMPRRAQGTLAADKQQLSNPLAISRLMSTLTLGAKIAQNPERFDALERAGFKVDRSAEVVAHVHGRYGGHYIDVGNCANIAKGLDSTHLPADVVVFATGYKWNARDTVGELFGKDVHDQVEDYWGLDKEGEVRGAFKPSPHGHIWFISGTTTHSRYYSRFMALLIKAHVMGVPVEVYRDMPGGADE
ncbi:hypothetical protein AbraIFM66950_011645 [Aspergillus brasiliensis]|nr:hypothetical protein AbraIFM66950_011645 [Aspergillus brasiliensis]